MLLKIGTVGEDVKKLQSKLGLTPDGSFGAITEAKVKEWQSRNNLKPDGIIGDISWKIMFPGAVQSSANPISTGDFKIQNLRGHLPDLVIDQIPVTAATFNITTTLRLAHFLSQCGHESAGFSAVVENLNYSAERLKEKFSKYFPDNAYVSYARNPVKIGSRVYANRNGNGDEASGEGYLFRGRGFIQLTGKSNYSGFAAFIGEDTVTSPELVATKYPLASAGYFFTSNSIWPVCDRGDTLEVVTAVTRRVNGGNNGLPDRIRHFNEFYNLLK